MNPLQPLAAQIAKAKLRINPLLDSSFDCGTIVEAKNTFQVNYIGDVKGIIPTVIGGASLPDFERVRGTKLSVTAALRLTAGQIPVNAKLAADLDRNTTVKLSFGKITTNRVDLMSATNETVKQIATDATLKAYLTRNKSQLVVAEVWVDELSFSFELTSNAGFDVAAKVAKLVDAGVAGRFKVAAGTSLVSTTPLLLALETAEWNAKKKLYEPAS